MKAKWFRRPVVAAAVIAALVISVSAAAAVVTLTPAQVAEEAGQSALSRAFESEDAILLNQTVQSGDFNITLLGLVSGAGLNDWNEDAEASHTYAVVALNRLDGAPLENETFPFTSYTLTPLVAGYSPTAVNNWTLGSFATGLDADGSYYYLLDTQDLNIFAHHTVYLAFYEGGAPSNSVFTVAEDGSIAFTERFTGVQALFTLPLDESQADDAAADAFAESTGLNHWSNQSGAGEDGIEDGSCLMIPDGQADGGAQDGEQIPYTVETFRAFMEREKAALQASVEAGTCSQEGYDQSIAMLERVLAGLEDGTMVAVDLGDGGMAAYDAPGGGDVQIGASCTLTTD